MKTPLILVAVAAATALATPALAQSYNAYSSRGSSYHSGYEHDRGQGCRGNCGSSSHSGHGNRYSSSYASGGYSGSSYSHSSSYGRSYYSGGGYAYATPAPSYSYPAATYSYSSPGYSYGSSSSGCVPCDSGGAGYGYSSGSYSSGSYGYASSGGYSYAQPVVRWVQGAYLPQGHRSDWFIRDYRSYGYAAPPDDCGYYRTDSGQVVVARLSTGEIVYLVTN